MYFCIGHDGKILSTGSTNKRKKNDKSDDTSYDKNNHQKIVLEAIEAVLSAYFMTMSSSFTETSINRIQRMYIKCQDKLHKVFLLQQELVKVIEIENDEVRETISKARKNHFYLHSVDQRSIQEYGPPLQFDTGPFETAHKTNTTSIWRSTSKR
jgi:hypothetical protein